MIIQTNTWICEKCIKIISISYEVLPYDDPIVNLPNVQKWGYKIINGKELLLCEECLGNI